jgi:hypothetical protein
MGLADNIARKASPSETASIKNATIKTTTKDSEARKDATTASRAPAPTLLPIIQQANTFKPGVPASLIAPPTLLSATGRSDGPRGVGGQNNNSTSGGSGGSSGASTPVTAAPVASTPVAATTTPSATPVTPKVEISNNQSPAIKSAPIDTVEFIDERFSDELIMDLLFEDVGGQELLTIARNDTVNGQSVIYQPFKNLGILQELYNPTTLLRLQQTSDKFFSNFTINLRDKIPNVGSGENGKNYKLDLATGQGIIEFINMRSDEQVEVQIISAGIIEHIDITEGTES